MCVVLLKGTPPRSGRTDRRYRQAALCFRSRRGGEITHL